MSKAARPNVTFRLGVTGLHNSYQQPFDAMVDCVHCGKSAPVAFTLCEGHRYRPSDSGYPLITDNIGEHHPAPHDYCAFAVYLCPYCFKASADGNQA